MSCLLEIHLATGIDSCEHHVYTDPFGTPVTMVYNRIFAHAGVKPG